jgi:HSP20 family molecular chaperone IbpA
MSSTTTKNILLSQPKIGSNSESVISSLTHQVFSNNDETVIEVEIPGVDPSTVEVKCESNTLTISCSKGQFSTYLEPSTDVSKIKADIQWGMLTLKVPAPETPQARAIKISIHDVSPKPEAKPAPKSSTVETRPVNKAHQKEFTKVE